MATRIAKGVASAKALGNTLTIAAVSLNSGSSLVVAAGYDDAQGHPTSVKWGQRELKPRITRDPATYDIAMSVWSVGSVRDTATRDVVITWAANINERGAVVTAVEGANKIDQQAGNNDNVATLTPVSGVSAPMTETSNFVLAFFVAEGPTTDIVSLPEVDVSGVWTAATVGQRTGTAGAPAAGNVTITEVYHQLVDACAATEARLTNDSARLWVNGIIAMETLSVYLTYYSSGKCTSCGDIMWCDNDINPVTCSCYDGTLNPDGTFIGTVVANTDQELIDAARLEIDAGDFDDIELVKL